MHGGHAHDHLHGHSNGAGGTLAAAPRHGRPSAKPRRPVSGTRRTATLPAGEAPRAIRRAVEAAFVEGFSAPAT